MKRYLLALAASIAFLLALVLLAHTPDPISYTRCEPAEGNLMRCTTKLNADPCEARGGLLVPQDGGWHCVMPEGQ